MPRRRSPKAEPVPAAPLPGAVTLLALLGLAILCLCTIPAVRKQQRLEREHTRLRGRTQELSADVERLRRELHDGAEQEYLRRKATRALLHKGTSYIARRDARLRARRLVAAASASKDGAAARENAAGQAGAPAAPPAARPSPAGTAPASSGPPRHGARPSDG